MGAACFELTCEGGIAQLRLNQPQSLNVLTLAGIEAFGEAVSGLTRDASVRCLVICSTGRHFTAGMDLQEFLGAGAALEVGSARARLRFQQYLARLMRHFDVLDQAPFPVIAAIQGGCIGGGVDLVAACDLRVCSADAFFVIQEISIGLAADLGTLQRLPKLIPPGIAREYAFTGRRMSAERALELGFVSSCHAGAEATLEAAMAMAAEIAAKSPLAIAVSKAALNYARDHGTRESLEHMTVLQSALIAPEEIRRSAEAHKSREQPRFADRDG